MQFPLRIKPRRVCQCLVYERDVRVVDQSGQSVRRQEQCDCDKSADAPTHDGEAGRKEQPDKKNQSWSEQLKGMETIGRALAEHSVDLAVIVALKAPAAGKTENAWKTSQPLFTGDL